MKKFYTCPSIAFNEAQTAQILAESLNINDDTVSGDQALTKEDNSWDIWSNEE